MNCRGMGLGLKACINFTRFLPARAPGSTALRRIRSSERLPLSRELAPQVTEGEFALRFYRLHFIFASCSFFSFPPSKTAFLPPPPSGGGSVTTKFEDKHRPFGRMRMFAVSGLHLFVHGRFVNRPYNKFHQLSGYGIRTYNLHKLHARFARPGSGQHRLAADTVVV